MSLETRYRRLLLAYPRSYRQHRGAEMVATLLDAAAADQTRPSRREVGDLLTGAARERLRLHDVPALLTGLRIAGAIALALAAGFATSDWILGPRIIVSTVVTAGWLLVVLASATAPRVVLVGATLLAWLATVAAIAVSAAHLTWAVVEPRTGFWQQDRYFVELACGLLVLAAVTLTDRRPGPVGWAAIPAGVATAGLLTVLLDQPAQRPAADGLYLPYPSWTHWANLVPVAAFAIGVVTAIRGRSTAWLWAAGLVAASAPITLAAWPPAGVGAWNPPLGSPLTDLTAGFAQCLLALTFVVVTASLAARDRAQPTPRDGREALAAGGALSLATAGGVSVYLFGIAVYHGDVAPADGLTLVLVAGVGIAAAYLPATLRRILIAAVVGVLVFGVYSGRTTTLTVEYVAAVGVLLIVGLAAPTGLRRISGWAPAGVVALFAAVSWVSFGGPFLWPELTQRFVLAPVVGAVLAPTLWWAAAVGARGTAWAGATVVFAAASCWLLLLTAPLHDSRIVGGLVIVAVVGLLGARAVQHRLRPVPAASP